MSKKSEQAGAPTDESSEKAAHGFSIGTTLLTAVAALAGTILGNGIREMVRSKLDATENESHGVDGASSVDIVVTGVISNTIAATALAHAASRRRPLVAFMIGAGLSAATGDAPDRTIMDLFRTDLDGFVAMDQDDEPDGV